MIGNQHNRTNYSAVDWNREWHGVSVRERFWSKVNIVDDKDSCWEWIGGRDPNGYGSFHVPVFGVRHAHSVAYFLTYGQIEDGNGILHRCDNRLCVRPDHLFEGTHAENMADRTAKGRSVPGDVRGERHGMSVLTEQNIFKIREMAASGYTHQEIADLFGVSRPHITYIIQKKKWSHI